MEVERLKEIEWVLSDHFPEKDYKSIAACLEGMSREEMLKLSAALKVPFEDLRRYPQASREHDSMFDVSI